MRDGKLTGGRTLHDLLHNPGQVLHARHVSLGQHVLSLPPKPSFALTATLTFDMLSETNSGHEALNETEYGRFV